MNGRQVATILALILVALASLGGPAYMVIAVLTWSVTAVIVFAGHR